MKIDGADKTACMHADVCCLHISKTSSLMTYLVLNVFQLKQVDLNAKVTQLEKQIENLQTDSMGQLRSRLKEVNRDFNTCVSNTVISQGYSRFRLFWKYAEIGYFG